MSPHLLQLFTKRWSHCFYTWSSIHDSLLPHSNRSPPRSLTHLAFDSLNLVSAQFARRLGDLNITVLCKAPAPKAAYKVPVPGVTGTARENARRLDGYALVLWVFIVVLHLFLSGLEAGCSPPHLFRTELVERVVNDWLFCQ